MDFTFTFHIIYFTYFSHSTSIDSNDQHTKLTSIIRISHYHRYRNYGQTFPTNLWYISSKLISDRSSSISIHMHVNLYLCVVSPILPSDNCCYLILLHWSEHTITCLIEYLPMHTKIYIHNTYIFTVYIHKCVYEKSIKRSMNILWNI